MNEQELSQRLRTVAEYIREGSVFADIGSDHAYLPCYVCLHDDRARAIAGEINEGPYQSALKQVKSIGLESRIEVRKGNGLSVFDSNEVDTVVIAGMGGSLIRSILEVGKDRLEGVKRIIAQPNVDEKEVRKWYYQNGFVLTSEKIIKEGDPIYEILVADRIDKSQPYQSSVLEKELLMGPYLLKDKNPIFIEKWTAEMEKRFRIIESIKQAKQPNLEKIKNYEREILWIKEGVG